MTRYADVDDFVLYGLKANAWGTATETDIEAELDAASEMMDDFLNGRYNLPLLSWPRSFRVCCCAIASYLLLVSPRGYNAGAGADENIRKRYDEMISTSEATEGYLRKVQRRVLHPVVTETQTDTRLEQPVILSSSVVDVSTGATAANRGW